VAKKYLVNKKIWRQWPANAAKFWRKKKKLQTSLSIQQSGVAKLNAWNGHLSLKKEKKVEN
jgi:hypothetical protein